MKERYNRAFDNIAPEKSDEELRKAVLRKAENTMEKKFNKKAVMIPVAAALTVAIGVGGVAAANNAEFIRNIFGGNESVAAEIQNYVFEDSDEHIRMTVDEYLSDGQCTYLTVHYQALDEEGQQWLADKNIIDDSNDNYKYYSALSIQPIFKESTDVFYPVSYICNTQELTECTTETDKYFCTYFEADSRHYGTEQARFSYILSDGVVRAAVLDVGTNVEEKWFELKDTETPSEFYIPKYLVLSEMSFSIYGENTGAFKDNSIPEEGLWSFKSLMTHEDYNTDAVKDISFVLDDGSRIKLEDYCCLGSAVAHEYNRYTDINIASGCFIEHDWSDGEYSLEFKAPDIDRVVGLQIGEAYYDLTK